MRKINRRGEEGGSPIGTIATIVIILVVIVVLIWIFSNRAGQGNEYLEAVSACEGMGGNCVSETQAEEKRNDGYSCFETCPDKNEKGQQTEDVWCCYKPFA